jgi:hypothetical protein
MVLVSTARCRACSDLTDEYRPVFPPPDLVLDGLNALDFARSGYCFGHLFAIRGAAQLHLPMIYFDFDMSFMDYLTLMNEPTLS